MSDILNNFPLFPINVIIFPGEIQPLHIFEARYKELIKDTEESNGLFGIPYITDGKLCKYGSAVTLHKILAVSPTGEMDVLVKGVNLFSIKDIEEKMQGKQYGGGTVEIMTTMNDFASETLINKFLIYRNQLEQINKTEKKDQFQPESLRIFEIAGQMPLELDEKYALIHYDCHEEREQFLVEKLDFLSLINKKLQEVGYRFYLN